VGIHLGTIDAKNINVATLANRFKLADVDALGSRITVERGCKIGGSLGHAIGQVTNPIKEAIKDLGLVPDFSFAINAIAKPISKEMSAKANNDGWTKASCYVAASGFVTAAAAGYSAAICSVMNVAAPACIAFLAASGPALVAVTCSQLCTDGHLADCK
jgi:hypothetical protein